MIIGLETAAVHYNSTELRQSILTPISSGVLINLLHYITWPVISRNKSSKYVTYHIAQSRPTITNNTQYQQNATITSYIRVSESK